MTKNQMQTNENIMKITYTLHKTKRKNERAKRNEHFFNGELWEILIVKFKSNLLYKGKGNKK